MDFKTFFKSFLKLSVMLVLTLFVVLASFAAGIWVQSTNALLPSKTQSQSAISIDDTIQHNETAFPSESENTPSMDVFWEAWNIVQQEFYSDIPSDQERVYGAIRGMVGTYGDDHTAFIDPSRAAILNEDASGSFEGIGATVRTDDLGRLVISEPYPGRPAAEAGVQRNDVVIEVDGKSLRGLSLYESVALIRGPAGSTVVLTILRESESEPLKIPVVRAKIDIEVVQSKLLDGNIGYVSLSEFSNGASQKMAKAINDLKAQGAVSLIVDLRGNPGGFLSEAISVSSLYLEKGTVVVREHRKDATEDEIFKAQGNDIVGNMPIVVLINGGSASASEIVSGALKDHARATLIGEQSYGKGTVQLPHTLSDGSQLRVTIAEWLTPDGASINKEGIVPDIVVELTQEDFVDGKDPQLDRAVEFLQGSSRVLEIPCPEIKHAN